MGSKIISCNCIEELEDKFELTNTVKKETRNSLLRKQIINNFLTPRENELADSNKAKVKSTESCPFHLKRDIKDSRNTRESTKKHELILF